MNICRHKHRHFVVNKDGCDRAVCDRCKDALMREGWTLTLGFSIGAHHKSDAVGMFGKVRKWLDITPPSDAQPG